MKAFLRIAIIIGLHIHLSCSFYIKISQATDLNAGKKIFISNCNVCHSEGKNLIIPEKNLKKEAMETNGMNNLNAIIYQITNGKNGMPAFGSRLKEKQIENVASYVYFFYVLEERGNL
jgi:cytochrome c6